jgi:hypothetical protein
MTSTFKLILIMFIMYCDKLEYTSLAVTFSLIKYFWQCQNFNRMKPLMGLHSKGWLLVLPSNFQSGRKLQ